MIGHAAPTRAVLPTRRLGDQQTPAWLLVAVLRDPLIWVIIGLGLGLRIVVGALMPYQGFMSDEPEYYAAARILADGRGFSYYDDAPWLRPPGYLAFLAACFRFLGPIPETARWVQVGLSFLLAPLAAWLVRLLDGPQWASRLAAAAVVLWLPLAVFPWLLLSETLFTLLLLAAVAGLLAWCRGGGLPWLVIAASMLGAACLVRGIALGFVALVVVGLLFASERRWTERLRAAAVVLLVVGVLIAPWTIRNAVAYQAFVPLETTAAFNLWLRAQDGRGASWITSELSELPNPAARQQHAVRRGMALVLENPAAYMAKGARELIDVWRLHFGSAERFMTGYSGGEVSRPWLLLSLILDDGLYLAIVTLAAVGFWRWRTPGRWVPLAWIAWTCVSALIFFAIARFRLPMVPLLAVYASLGLASLPHARTVQQGRFRALGLASLVVLPLLLTLDGRAYWQAWQMRPHWEQAWQAEAARLAGQNEAALRLVQAAAPVTEAVIVESLALAEAGRVEAAERGLEPLRDDVRGMTAAGEVKRLAGDRLGAASAWSQRAVNVANPLVWAWGRVGSPGRVIEVGDGLDMGLVRGMYSPERDGDRRFRWTDGRATVRLNVATPGDYTLTIRARAYRPDNQDVPARLSVDGRPAAIANIPATWTSVTMSVHLEQTDVELSITSPTFVPGYADDRALGIMVDEVMIEPAE